MNVERAWLQGLTGCNVTVGIVDDGKIVREPLNCDHPFDIGKNILYTGIDYLHEDLWDNFVSICVCSHSSMYNLTVLSASTYISAQDPFTSYDALDEDHDPMAGSYDVHGTKCAGIVSAAKNNDTCGVGIAYNSNLAG